MYEIVGACDRRSRAPATSPCLTAVPANGRTGIDVDKFDYMARDALNVGVKTTFDFSRCAPPLLVCSMLCDSHGGGGGGQIDELQSGCRRTTLLPCKRGAGQRDAEGR